MAAVGVRHQRPAAIALELFGSLRRVERSDRLRRPVERGIVCGDAHVREDAGRLPLLEHGPQLGRDQHADLGLRLRDRKPERQGRRLLGSSLLPQQLVAHLGAVAVCDDEAGLREQRLECRYGPVEVGELLGRRASLAGAHERVPAEGHDRAHTSAVSSSPLSASTSSSVGSPISWSL